MKAHTIIEYSLAALLVLILGAFSGWYFFLSTQSRATTAADAARGHVSLPPTSPLFGTADDSSRASATVPGAAPTTQVKRPPRLWHAQIKPVAGMAFVRSAGGERLRYVERATGYVYDVDVETGITERITNTLVPKTYEAIVTPGGRIIQRSLNDEGRIRTTIGVIATSSATESSTSTAPSLTNISLAADIARITVNPQTGALFYLVRDASGIVGFRSEWNGAKPTRVFSSTIMHWHPLWLSDNRIILVQAAADNMPGFAYEMGPNGAMRPIMRNVPGLTILPRAGGALLYGESRAGELALFAQISPTTTAVRLPIKTVADKCVWASGKDLVAYCGVPQGFVGQDFLDGWYRGIIHSSDAMWRVSVSAGAAEIVYTPDTGTSIDIENPMIDSTGSYIAFMNNNDESLWILRLDK